MAATARWTAAERARESERPDALFRDPWAKALAGADTVSRLNTVRAEVRDASYTAIRTRVFDDWLTAATGGAQGIRQVVLLGAGMDMRAFRLNWPEGVQLWELDQAEVLELKQAILAQSAPNAGCIRRTVALDLLSDDVAGRLTGATFRPDVSTAWLAEGLLVYLKPEAAERLLATITRLSAPGSQLAAEFVAEGFIRSRNAYLQSLAPAGARASGAPWYFGTNDPRAWLAQCGWHADWVREPGDAGANFGRWTAPSTAAENPGYSRFFFVAADLRGGPAHAN